MDLDDDGGLRLVPIKDADRSSHNKNSANLSPIKDGKTPIDDDLSFWFNEEESKIEKSPRGPARADFGMTCDLYKEGLATLDQEFLSEKIA